MKPDIFIMAGRDPGDAIDVAYVDTLSCPENDLSKWWAVMDCDGIIAYFSSESNACFFKESAIKSLKEKK